MRFKQLLLLTILTLTIQTMSAINFYDSNKDEITKQLLNKSLFEQIILLDNFINKNPNDIELYRMKARAELSARDYKGVITTIEKALKYASDDIELYRLYAIATYYSGEYQKSYDKLSIILSKSPKDEVALLFKGLIPEKYKNTNIFIPHYPDIPSLYQEYSLKFENGVQEDFPFFYLYQGKNIEVKDSASYNYEMTAIIRINEDSKYEELSKYTIYYDDEIFTPSHTEASIINAENKISNIEIERQPGVLMIPFIEQKAGSYLRYSIYFTMKKSDSYFSDSFYTASQLKVYKKTLCVTHNQNIPLKFETIKLNIEPEITKNNGIVTTTYTQTDPEFFYLNGESISLYELSPAIIVSSYPNWKTALQNFNSLYIGYKNKALPQEISSQLEKINNKTELVKNLYTIFQKYKQNIDFNDQIINGLEETAILSNMLKRFQIESEPIIFSQYGNEEIVEEIATPEILTTSILHINEQNGIKESFLDSTNIFTTVGITNFLYQGRKGIILSENEATSFITIPFSKPEENLMKESYKLEISPTGRANMHLNQSITGGFAEYFRTSIVDLSDSERFDYFFNLQKNAFSSLKPEDIKVEGIDSISGDIQVVMNTEALNLTEVHYDGTQLFTFALSEVKDWITLPEFSRYPFRKNFLYTYSKSMDCKFPDGYSVEPITLINTAKSNEYVEFLFNAEKISDNHFTISYSLKLLKPVIEPQDILIIQSAINNISSMSFTLKVHPTPEMNAETFFDDLLNEYPQDQVYKNYISRLISDEKYDKALIITNKGRELFPNEVYYPILLSIIFHIKGDFQKAELELEKALLITEDPINVYGYLFDLYKKTNNQEKLYKTLLIVHEKYPNDNSVIVELIEYYKSKEDYISIIELLEKAVITSPESADYHSDLGYFYSLIGNSEKSESSLINALKINPENSYALNNLAWLYCEENRNIDKALELSIKAVSIEDNNFNFYDTLAECYFKSNNFQKALESIDKAIQINPDFEYLLEQKNKILKAIEENTEK